MFIALLRIIKFAWQDFWRNFWLTFATVVIITLTFISISVLFVFNDIADNVLDKIQKKVDISIYLKNTLNDEQIKQVEQYLRRIDDVEEVVYVSREESLFRFRTKHQDNSSLISSLNELGENPLGVTFIVKAKNINSYQNILQEINNFKNQDYIADKNFENYQKITSRISSFSDKIRQVGLIWGMFSGLISILIVFNTIRVSIYTHQNEIEIMKLVGATNFFIKGPYLFVSMAYTLVSAFFAYLIFYPLVNLASPYMWQYFEGTFYLHKYFFGDFVKIILLELLIMLVVNLIASSVAIRKYLRR